MVPFCPFYFGVPLLKPDNKKKGTLIVMGLLRNLVLFHTAALVSRTRFRRENSLHHTQVNYTLCRIFRHLLRVYLNSCLSASTAISNSLLSAHYLLPVKGPVLLGRKNFQRCWWNLANVFVGYLWYSARTEKSNCR